MQTRSIKRVCLAVLVGLLVAACPPPPPPPAPTPGPMSASSTNPSSVFTYNVTVNVTGPPSWTYTLKALFGPSSPGDFSAVEIHSLCRINASDVSVLLTIAGPPTFGRPASTTPPAFTITQPAPTDVRIESNSAPSAGWSTMILQLQADCQNGSVHFTFDEGLTVATSPARFVVGPVAGPQ